MPLCYNVCIPSDFHSVEIFRIFPANDGSGISEGNACRIFIENNGAVQKDGQITTKPLIYTDSKALAWLEQADLTGHVQPAEHGVRIGFEM